MVSGIRIGNFKAFGGSQGIPVRPITVVFGPNSSGKSSIIQSLLLARHIADTGDADVHQTTLGGGTVDLGGFAHYVHGHQVANEVELTFEFSATRRRKPHLLDPFQRLTATWMIGYQDGQPGARALRIAIDDRPPVSFGKRADGKVGLDDPEAAAAALAADYQDYRDIPQKASAILADPQRLANLREVCEDLCGPPVDDPATGAPTTKSVQTCVEWSWSSRDRAKFEVVVEQLRHLLLEDDGFQFSVANPLARETSDYVWFTEGGGGGPESDPFEFYKAYLRSDEGKKDASDDDVAACVFRFEFETLLDELGRKLAKSLAALTYLGPLRCVPPRHLIEAAKNDPSWVAAGGSAWDAVRRDGGTRDAVNRLLADVLGLPYQLRTRTLGPLDPATVAGSLQRALKTVATRKTGHVVAGPTPLSAVAEDAADYGPVEGPLAAALQAELLVAAGDAGMVELFLADARSGLAVSHRDVGMGIGQLVPVVVVAAASRERLIAVEQPELHLHPALQAELGDVVIESALGPAKNTFLIETHSEHFILRLLKRVRQTTGGETAGRPAIRPEDVAFVYVQPTEQGSFVHHLRVDQHGRLLDPCPGGFFEEDFAELF